MIKHDPKDDDSFYRTSKLDLVLIGLILFIATFSVVQVSAYHIQQSSQPKVAMIYQENILLNEVDLMKDNTFPILNGKMHIEVRNGGIRILDSDCPQRICVKAGYIQYSGQTIVCLPNKILIEIKSTGTPSLDAISY